MNVMVSLKTVDLDNCDTEPIQSPGSIQPHGVLMVFNLDGSLTHISSNATGVFPDLPSLGQRPTFAQLWRSNDLQPAADVMEVMLEDAKSSDSVDPIATIAKIDGMDVDVVLHARASQVIVEFEPSEGTVGDQRRVSVTAQRAVGRLKKLTSVETLLADIVQSVRQLTGFDRVMAYRFLVDGSGEVVAESRVEELTPYLHRRFPATDIPIQARHLYLINTLRLIANVHDDQVVIHAFAPGMPALDLSHSILRSVSPIHIEYLKNINVAASMSVSIVIGGKLWGLIACHHRAPHRVPYSVRRACDVLAQVLATAISLVLEKSANVRREAALALRSKLVDLGDQGEEAVARFGPSQSAVSEVIPHDSMVFAHGNDLVHDGLQRDAAMALVQWLEHQREALVHMDNTSSLPEKLSAELAPFSGLLAMRHDQVNKGWTILLRREQTLDVTWSGPPDKVARIGPLGARLTPDGSLAEWQEAVRGRSLPWDEMDLALAQLVLDEVTRTTSARALDIEQARAHLLGILGHDLRTPLQTISAVAALLQRQGLQQEAAQRLTRTTTRMGRLISQVLDMSRLHGGIGLGLKLEQEDLAALVRELVDESLIARSTCPFRVQLPASLLVCMDRDRMTQVLANLLGNARHHGMIGKVITVELISTETDAIITVGNVAPPLSDEVVAQLFDPLKKTSVGNARNPGGLGLGLFIANEAVKGHGGSLTYRHDGSRVYFTVKLPLSSRAN